MPNTEVLLPAKKLKESMNNSDDSLISEKNENLGFLHRTCLMLSNQILQFPLLFELQQRILRQPELLRNEVKKELEFYSGAEKDYKILDYGCGSGTYTGLFPESKYLGVDCNRRLIERACELNPEHQFVLASDLVDMSEELSSISHVIMIGVVHHLSNRAFVSIVDSLPKDRPIKLLTIDTIKATSQIGKFIQLFERGEFLRSEEEHLNLLHKAAKEDSYTKVPYGKFFDLAVFRGYLNG